MGGVGVRRGRSQSGNSVAGETLACLVKFDCVESAATENPLGLGSGTADMGRRVR